MKGYSELWFETFLRSIPDERTDREATFIMRCLPVARFPRILDLCCGAGRHAVRLAGASYDVVGVDADEKLLRSAARLNDDRPRYVYGDMRSLEPLGLGSFDGAIVMWQSFGQFDPTDNDLVMSALSRHLRKGGRLVLDLYHRDFFVEHQGRRTLERAGVPVVETKSIDGNRLFVRLEYEDGGIDAFDWELYTPSELGARAARADFELIGACSNFDVRSPATSESPRFQAWLQRV